MNRATLLWGVCFAAACASTSVGERWRSKPPPVSMHATFRPAAADTHTLANGVGVWVSTLPDTTTTRVALVVARGHADPHAAPDSIRILGGWLELEAIAARSERFDALGARLRVTVDATTTRLEVDVLNAEVPQAMEAITQLIENSGDASAFEAARQRQLAKLSRLRRTPEQLATSAAMQATLGPGYAHFDPQGQGSEANVRRVRFEDVLAARDAWMARAAATWVVVGPHKPGAVRRWAWSASQAWPHREQVEDNSVEPPVVPGTLTVVPIAGLDPAVVVVSKALRPTHQRTSTETGFSAGIGLAHARLREGAQQTYGVRGRIVDEGPLHAAVATTRVPARDAVSAASVIVGSFRAVAPYVDDLPVAWARRSETVRATANSMETDVRASAMYRALAGGAPVDAVPPFGPLPPLASPARVRRALQTEFQPEDFHIVLAGDLQVIKAQLRNTDFRVRTDIDIVGPLTLPDE